MPDNKEKLHAGHRARMREKFSLYGRDVFHTHELLEMLLYHAIPCKNTNNIAINLIKRFSTLDGVLSASREELLSVEGVGPRVADMLLSVGRITPQSVNAVENRRTFDDFAELGSFLVDYFDGRESYEVVVMLLNSRMQFISFEALYHIDYSSGGIKADKFIDAAIRARASVAVIAHNHPYGPALPSSGDIATNTMVESSLAKAGIMLLEHYVISGSSYTGFMKHLDVPFSQPYEIGRFLESKELSV